MQIDSLRLDPAATIAQNDALLAGRWRAALEAAVSAPPPPETPRTDGADVIADMIAAHLSRPTANHEAHQDH